MPRDFERFETREELYDAPSAHAAKIRVRYLVEKLIEGAWVLMARLPVESELDQMENLCFAIGGTVRVEDVTRHEYVLDKEFE
jgi:hypothetical protein